MDLEGAARAQAVVMDLLRPIIRDGFREAYAGRQLRVEAGLGATGAKPALLTSVIAREDGSRQVGWGSVWWDTRPLLDAMASCGFSVGLRPHHLRPAEG